MQGLSPYKDLNIIRGSCYENFSFRSPNRIVLVTYDQVIDQSFKTAKAMRDLNIGIFHTNSMVSKLSSPLYCVKPLANKHVFVLST